jgi:hypothetical protein
MKTHIILGRVTACGNHKPASFTIDRTKVTCAACLRSMDAVAAYIIRRERADDMGGI